MNPKIEFDTAEDYPDLFNWSKTKLTEPPLVSHLPTDEIQSFVDVPLSVPAFPCHTQAVERAIRLVSEASTSVVGEESRNGFIRQWIRSRKELGRYDTKKQYYGKIDSCCASK